MNNIKTAIEALRQISELTPATCEMTVAHEMGQIAEEALAALTASSVQEQEPIGSVLKSADGLIQDFRPRVRTFFGAIMDDDVYIHDADDIANADKNYPGLAPHSVELVYPAMQASPQAEAQYAHKPECDLLKPATLNGYAVVRNCDCGYLEQAEAQQRKGESE